MDHTLVYLLLIHCQWLSKKGGLEWSPVSKAALCSRTDSVGRNLVLLRRKRNRPCFLTQEMIAQVEKRGLLSKCRLVSGRCFNWVTMRRLILIF